MPTAFWPTAMRKAITIADSAGAPSRSSSGSLDAEAGELAEAVVGEQRLGDADGEEQRQQAAACGHARRHAPAQRRGGRAGRRLARRRRDLLGGGVGGDEVVVERAHAHRALHERAQPRADEVVGVLGDALGDDPAADAVGVVARVQRLGAVSVVRGRGPAAWRRRSRARRGRRPRPARRSPGWPAAGAARRAAARASSSGAAASCAGSCGSRSVVVSSGAHRVPRDRLVTARSSSRSSPRRSARMPSSRCRRARRCAARSG